MAAPKGNKYAVGNNGGQKPRYSSVAEMDKAIEDYFKSCEGKPLCDDEGNALKDKYGRVILFGEKPPTVTGLALALGFTSRQALLNYQEKEEFVDSITRAKSRVEEYTETRLFDKDGANGAKFSLSNNFKGWSEKQEIKAEITTKEELEQLSDEELQERLIQLKGKTD